MTQSRGLTVLVIEPQKAARERAGKLVEALGHEVRLAESVLEAHALFDQSNAVVASHPHAAEIYPRLRATGTPLIASFATRLWVFGENGLHDFWGDYESYLQKHGDDAAQKRK